MKTIYTPRYLVRKDAFSSLLYFTQDSTGLLLKNLSRLKLLIVPLLLLSQTVRAQQLIAMGNNKPSSRKNINISDINLKEETSSEITTTISNKADSAFVNQSVPKETLKFIPNNENKAKAMIDSYFKGMDDADSNYRVKKSAKAAILLTTLIGGPVVGLVPTVALSSAKPNNKSLNIPTSALVSDDAYMKGYKSEAHYIKKHNTWPCYVLASIVWLAAANMILR